MSDEIEEVRRKAEECICHICDQSVTVHDGHHLTSSSYAPAIRDAVQHSNRHPSNSAREGDLKYVVEDGYYPDDKQHFVDLQDVDEDLRGSASIQIMSQLAHRGLVVNSVRWSPPRLHVIAVEDVSYGYYGDASTEGSGR